MAAFSSDVTSQLFSREREGASDSKNPDLNYSIAKRLPGRTLERRRKKGEKIWGMLLSANEKTAGTPEPHYIKPLIDSPASGFHNDLQ